MWRNQLILKPPAFVLCVFLVLGLYVFRPYAAETNQKTVSALIQALKDDDSRLKRLVETLSRRDFTYLLFPLAALGWLGGFLWVAAVGAWLFTLAVVILRFRAWRVSLSTGGGKHP